jgi:hypothetical protein
MALCNALGVYEARAGDQRDGKERSHGPGEPETRERRSATH